MADHGCIRALLLNRLHALHLRRVSNRVRVIDYGCKW